jgi:hypothetical protein
VLGRDVVVIALLTLGAVVAFAIAAEIRLGVDSIG